MKLCFFVPHNRVQRYEKYSFLPTFFIEKAENEELIAAIDKTFRQELRHVGEK